MAGPDPSLSVPKAPSDAEARKKKMNKKEKKADKKEKKGTKKEKKAKNLDVISDKKSPRDGKVGTVKVFVVPRP